MGRLCKGWLQLAVHEHALYVHIPKRLAGRQLFHALPAEYPANTEVEARKCASADDLYDEQQVYVCCAEEQLVGEGLRTCYVHGSSSSGIITTKCRENYSRACCVAAEPSHSPLLRLLIAHLHFHSPRTLLIPLCLTSA